MSEVIHFHEKSVNRFKKVKFPEGITLKENVEISIDVNDIGETIGLTFVFSRLDEKGDSTGDESFDVEVQIEPATIFEGRLLDPMAILENIPMDTVPDALGYVMACVIADEADLLIENGGEVLTLNLSLRGYSEDRDLSLEDAAKYFNLPKYMLPEDYEVDDETDGPSISG